MQFIFQELLLYAFFLRFAGEILNISGPLLLSLIINYIERANDPDSEKSIYFKSYFGYVYVALMFLIPLMQAVCIQHYFKMVNRAMFSLMSGIGDAVYRKSLRISACGDKDSTKGEVINLLGVDSKTIAWVRHQRLTIKYLIAIY